VPTSVVADKNYLEHPSLELFLREDAGNKVLLHDFSAIESLAGNPLKNLCRTLSIVSKFPDQVLILKNSRTLLAMGAIRPEFRFEMVDWPQTRSFGEYCEDVQKAEAGDELRRAAVAAHARDASEHLAKMLTIVPLMTDLIGRLAATTDPGVIVARRKGDIAMPGEGGAKLIHEAFDIASAIAERGNAPRVPLEIDEAAQHYVLRFAVALRLFALRWAEAGSDVRDARPELLRNDFVDLIYITCATYWDDFLTSEKKMAHIYSETSFLVNDLLSRKRLEAR